MSEVRDTLLGRIRPPESHIVLAAGVGGLAETVTRLLGDSDDWVRVIAEAKDDPLCQVLLDPIYFYGEQPKESPQIDIFLDAMTRGGTFVRDLNTGLFLTDPISRRRLYERNVPRLVGTQGEALALFSGYIGRLVAY